MKFRTEVSIGPSERKIEPRHKIFTIGSCFATEMAAVFQKGQFQTFHNPFGTLFSPHAVHTALSRLHSCQYYDEQDLIQYGDQIISLDHHSSFSSLYTHQTLEKINYQIEEGNLFLQSADWVIITLGSSFVYDFLPKNRRVANCHKIPQKFFAKNMLTSEEISSYVSKMYALVKDICPVDTTVLFSVSPVRHVKDGFTENLWSKSRLIDGILNALNGMQYAAYLPIYELLMDDLRDYRFYKSDLLHPNEQAVDYIFSKFEESYFSFDARSFLEENLSISRALSHRPFQPQSQEYERFIVKIKERVNRQRLKVEHPIFQEL